jgi:hypothetical protein
VGSRDVRVDEKGLRCHSRKVKRRAWLRTIVGLVVVCCVAATAQEKGYWRAESSTAKSITGDLALSDEKISINLVKFTVSRIRGLEKDEAGVLFEQDGAAAGNGSLYRLNIPATSTFLRKNTLCGSEDTQWMVTYVSGRSLRVVFFSGQKSPVFTPDAIANSTDLCGRFGYVR